MDSLDISYSEFKNAIHSSLAERLRERLAREKQIISTTILGDSEEDDASESQSNAEIVQSLLLKDYASLKESVFSLLYAKASVALDEARVAVANAVFNEASEIKPSPERAARTKREIGKPLMYAGKKAGTTGIRTAEGKLKEATEQLDEVSPPDMEKMTGSKKTKASFTKQYGKRGKSVMYATAWKLHNKKAGKD